MTLTWFGGHVDVRWNADSRLHLMVDDAQTFCGISTGLRDVTVREADSNACKWCETCFQRATSETAS